MVPVERQTNEKLDMNKFIHESLKAFRQETWYLWKSSQLNDHIL